MDNIQDAIKKGRMNLYEIGKKGGLKGGFKKGCIPKSRKLSNCKAADLKYKMINRGSKTLKQISIEECVTYSIVKDINVGKGYNEIVQKLFLEN